MPDQTPDPVRTGLTAADAAAPNDAQPAPAVAMDAAIVLSPAWDAADVQVVPPPRQTVLVVDDLAVNTAFVTGMLEGECRVMTASTGVEALRQAARDLPDLILLDLQLADMHGFDVCRSLKEDPLTAAIPVIFLTALSDDAHEAEGLRLGAIDFIAKPFSGPVFRARVRNHLELVRQRAALQRLSSLDGLTGIANRRAFDAALEEQWRHMGRLQRPLAVLLIDVDHFKAYNDSQGHLDGDACLRRVATAIAGAFRQAGAIAARYGGEEFACLLANADRRVAMTVAQRISAAIQALAVPHPASPTAPCVTVSIGCATCVPQAGQDASMLVQDADRALYAAKAAGRNQVQPA